MAVVAESINIETEIDVEAALAQYAPLIHKLANQCARKLPRGHMYQHEDLFSEGQIRLVLAARGYKAPKGGLQGPRAFVPGQRLEGASFIRYLHQSLVNGFAKIVEKEWRKQGKLDLKGPASLERIQVGADQRAVDVAVDMERGYLPDRYEKLSRHRSLAGR